MRATPPLVICAALTGLVLVVASGACGGEEEAAQRLPTGSPTAGAIATPALAPTVTPTAAPTATPSVPKDWVTYVDSEQPALAFRYPPNWFTPGPGRIQSWDPSGAKNGQGFPLDGVMVDFGRFALPADPAAIETPPPGAAATTLAGAPGWEWVLTQEADPGQWKWSHQVWLDRNGYRFWLGGYFPEKDSNETVFRQIMSTLVITE